MSENRPRPSIINLFDPLVNAATGETPSTPQHRPSDADKETCNNSSDGLTMTLFVNKIAQTVSHPQPTPLKRRLIDIGDMTLEDAACPEALLDESVEDEFSTGFEQVEDEEENATLTFKDMVKAATPHRTLKTVLESPTYQTSPMSRLPLADMESSEATYMPCLAISEEAVVPKETPEEAVSGESAGELALAELIPQRASTPELATKSFIVPEDIPLPPSPVVGTQKLTADFVVDRVSDDGLSSRRAYPGLDNLTDATDKSAPTPSNELGTTDLSADLDSVKISTLSLTESSEAPLADTSIPIVVSRSSPTSSAAPLPEIGSKLGKENPSIARLRPSPPTTSSQDTNRFSVDLHASFQMHMQSEDMSFDLLSDKVSFLHAQNGLESFLSTTDDDPSFDLETERINMEKALKKCSGDRAKEEKVSLIDGEISRQS